MYGNNGVPYLIMIYDVLGSKGFIANGFVFAEARCDFTKEEKSWIYNMLNINAAFLLK